MARIQMLNAEGEKLSTADGRPKTLHSVDGASRVRIGELIEIREVQQIGDKKRNVLVAYRPKTENDKKKERAAKKAKLKALQAELNGEETLTQEVSEPVKEAVKAPEVESEEVDEMDAALEEAIEEPKKGRKPRPPRPTK